MGDAFVTKGKKQLAKKLSRDLIKNLLLMK